MSVKTFVAPQTLTLFLFRQKAAKNTVFLNTPNDFLLVRVKIERPTDSDAKNIEQVLAASDKEQYRLIQSKPKQLTREVLPKQVDFAFTDLQSKKECLGDAKEIVQWAAKSNKRADIVFICRESDQDYLARTQARPTVDRKQDLVNYKGQKAKYAKHRSMLVYGISSLLGDYTSTTRISSDTELVISKGAEKCGFCGSRCSA
jgi:hypothetical protein